MQRAWSHVFSRSVSGTPNNKHLRKAVSRWRRALLSLQGLAPTLHACTAAVRDCTKVSLWSDALHLFTSAEQANMCFDEMGINAAIGAASRGSQWERALWLFGQISVVTQPGVVGYGAIIDCCGRAVQWQAAVQLAVGSGFASGACTGAAISGCGRASMWAKSILLLNLHTFDVVSLTARTSMIGWIRCWRSLGLSVNISGQRRRANRWRTPVDAVT